MTLVKICGIRSIEEGRAALRAGANWLGFVFWHPSKRFLEPIEAATVIRALRTEHAEWSAVGVFVNPAPAEVHGTIETAALDLVQLSGDEEPSFAREIGSPVVKALRVQPGREAEVTATVREDHFGAAHYLLDTHKDGWYGGTGDTFDWRSLRELGPRCIIAGGLRPENVTTALETLRPFGLDVSSGVEHPGGGKDPRRIQAFVEAVRAYDFAGTR